MKLQYFGYLMRRADSFEKSLMLGLRAGGEGDDRGRDGWMASLTWWTWVWVNSRSWWWTGRPGVLRFNGVAKIRTWLSDWTEMNFKIMAFLLFLSLKIWLYFWHILKNDSLWVSCWTHPIHEWVNESRSVVSNSLRPHGLQPARLLCPWGFSRQEYWSGLPFPPPGDLPTLGVEPRSPELQADYGKRTPPKVSTPGLIPL